VSALIDLTAFGEVIGHGFNRVYGWHFLYVSPMRRKALEKFKSFPEDLKELRVSEKRVRAATTLSGFDDALTAPLHGFRDNEDYWTRASSTELLRDIRVPWSFLLVTALYFVPSYALIAGLMIAIGSAMTEVRQGQQIAGVFNLLIFIPYFFLIMFINSPNSPLAVILTLFPATSFTTITLRWGLTTIPTWHSYAASQIPRCTDPLMGNPRPL